MRRASRASSWVVDRKKVFATRISGGIAFASPCSIASVSYLMLGCSCSHVIANAFLAAVVGSEKKAV